MKYEIHIPNWQPCLQNAWHGKHWAIRNRLKKADQEMVAVYAIQAGISLAVGKRRVGLQITLGPRQRGGDPDGYWKSLLDALVACGLLVDDRKEWVEITPVIYQRGEERATLITLEDIP